MFENKTARIIISNFVDKKNAEQKIISEDKIRSYAVEMIIDSEATLPVIDEDLAEALGIEKEEEILGWHSNGYESIEPCYKGHGVLLKFGNRTSLTSCVILKRGTVPLLGQIPLEEMDLLVDTMGLGLIPNPVSPNDKAVISL